MKQTNKMAKRERGLSGILHGGAPVTLTIVRHGATRLNNQTDVSVDRERGWSDVPLTEEGRQEAREAAAKLKGKGIEIIVSSDLVRAKETAQIIGRELGIKPEYSFKLRPWNLGDLTGKPMDEASPQIEAYAKKPGDKVPGGESFDAFNTRLFEGFAEIVAKHRGKRILIVAHHRVERDMAGWDKRGQPPDHSIDIAEFMAKGDPPGGIITLKTSEDALQGDSDYGRGGYADDESGSPAQTDGGGKLTHAQAHYGLAKGADTCSACRAYHGKDNCDKVVPPIYPGGWCAVGVSRADGHPFDQEAGETSAQEAAEPPQQEMAEQQSGIEQPPVGGSAAMAHGRAIAGAKALHAVGHISAQERDKHMAASRKAMRKPFGSFAPQ